MCFCQLLNRRTLGLYPLVAGHACRRRRQRRGLAGVWHRMTRRAVEGQHQVVLVTVRQWLLRWRWNVHGHRLLRGSQRTDHREESSRDEAHRRATRHAPTQLAAMFGLNTRPSV
jgi:hypothetical protein